MGGVPVFLIVEYTHLFLFFGFSRAGRTSMERAHSCTHPFQLGIGGMHPEDGFCTRGERKHQVVGIESFER